MPHSAAGPHPFDSAGGQNALDSGGLLILDRAFMQHRERGDSRMGMPAKVRCARGGDIKEIQEYKGLDELANNRRADQARNGSMPPSSGAKHDGAAGGR